MDPGQDDPRLAGVRLDDAGYLLDPAQWSESIAQAQAERQGLTLGPDHWAVIHFVRTYFDEHQIAPDARHAMQVLDAQAPGQGRKRLFELFPYGHVAQVCRIAGMRQPRAWSSG